jgi:hypothetical protein
MRNEELMGTQVPVGQAGRQAGNSEKKNVCSLSTHAQTTWNQITGFVLGSCTTKQLA